MNKGATLRTLAALLLAVASVAAADAPDAAWLLTYAGKPASAAVGDRRMIPMLRTRIPSAVIGRVIAGLGAGVGASTGTVAVVDGRFVAMSGCKADDCRSHALLWIDAKGTAALGAVYEAAASGEVLTMGSNGLTPAELPDAARSSILSWLSARMLDPDRVEFVGPSNLPHSIDPMPFRPPTQGQ